MSAAVPIPDDEADRLFAPLLDHRKLLLAVSGGADSMALLHLIARWRSRRETPPAQTGGDHPLPAITVATVDHQLRPEARDEAQWVGTVAAGLGLEHHILTWDAAKPATGVQQAARVARYRLLHDQAQHQGGALIVTAHHLDDQAETVLMRLARGSGVTGLAGMAPIGSGIARPLLDMPKARLVATLEACDGQWREDPSNANVAFERVRLRGVMPYLREAGLDAGPIAASARRLRRASDALDAITAWQWRELVALHAGLAATLSWVAWSALPKELRVRLVGRLLAAFGSVDDAHLLSRAETIAGRLMGPDFRRQTMAGCAIERVSGTITVWREPGRAGLPRLALAPGEVRIWDRRFEVTLAPSAARALTVAAVGLAPLRKFRSDGRPLPMLADPILASAPGFWAGTELVAAPQLGFAAEGWEIAALVRFLDKSVEGEVPGSEIG